MIGVIIAIGEEYEQRAQAMAPRSRAALQLRDVVILGKDFMCGRVDERFNEQERIFRRIFRLKFHLPAIAGIEPYVYLDSDLQFCGVAPAHEIDLIHNSPDFLAVRDRPYNSSICEERKKLGLELSSRYVNGGFYVVKPHHHDLMRWCLEKADPNDWYPEQTTLNRGLLALNVKTTFLNRTMNYMREENPIEARVWPCVRHGKEVFSWLDNAIIPDPEAMRVLAGKHVIDGRAVELQPDGFTDQELAWWHDGRRRYVYDPRGDLVMEEPRPICTGSLRSGSIASL